MSKIAKNKTKSKTTQSPHKKNKYSKMQEFIKASLESFKKDSAAIIANFIAIILGVLIAFNIENSRIKKSEINACKNKLFCMSLEVNKNLRNGIQIWHCYENPDTSLANIMILDDAAAKSVFEDANITEVITPSELAVISDYINTIQHVNLINERYLFHLDAVNYQIVEAGRKLRELLKYNASSFLAIGYVVQNKLLNKYIDRKWSDSINIHPYKNEIDSLLNNFIYEGKWKIVEK